MRATGSNVYIYIYTYIYIIIMVPGFLLPPKAPTGRRQREHSCLGVEEQRWERMGWKLDGGRID